MDAFYAQPAAAAATQPTAAAKVRPPPQESRSQPKQSIPAASGPPSTARWTDAAFDDDEAEGGGSEEEDSAREKGGKKWKPLPVEIPVTQHRSNSYDGGGYGGFSRNDRGYGGFSRNGSGDGGGGRAGGRYTYVTQAEFDKGEVEKMARSVRLTLARSRARVSLESLIKGVCERLDVGQSKSGNPG